MKSLLFSYKTFLKIKLKKNLLSRLKKIEKKYNEMRTDYSLERLDRKKYFFFINNLKNLDYYFSEQAYIYFEKFPDIELKNVI